MWKIVLQTTAFTVPVTITTLNVFGYVAKVEGASMQPTLNPSTLKEHDYVFLNRWKVRNRYEFTRGEVVSLTCPNNPDQKLIKRIIALEGDTVRTHGYRSHRVKIPAGHCWLEGDHRGQSMDSNLFGPVALGLITAKATHIVWPPHRWQRIKTTHVDSRLIAKKNVDDAMLDERFDDFLDNLGDDW